MLELELPVFPLLLVERSGRFRRSLAQIPCNFWKLLVVFLLLLSRFLILVNKAQCSAQCYFSLLNMLLGWNDPPASAAPRGRCLLHLTTSLFGFLGSMCAALLGELWCSSLYLSDVCGETFCSLLIPILYLFHSDSFRFSASVRPYHFLFIRSQLERVLPLGR